LSSRPLESLKNCAESKLTNTTALAHVFFMTHVNIRGHDYLTKSMFAFVENIRRLTLLVINLPGENTKIHATLVRFYSSFFSFGEYFSNILNGRNVSNISKRDNHLRYHHQFYPYGIAKPQTNLYVTEFATNLEKYYSLKELIGSLESQDGYWDHCLNLFLRFLLVARTAASSYSSA
jgi:hypothetical protein